MNDLTVIPGSGMGEPDVETEVVLEPVAERLAAWLGTVSAEAALAAQLSLALGDGESERIPE